MNNYYTYNWNLPTCSNKTTNLQFVGNQVSTLAARNDVNL